MPSNRIIYLIEDLNFIFKSTALCGRKSLFVFFISLFSSRSDKSRAPAWDTPKNCQFTWNSMINPPKKIFNFPPIHSLKSSMRLSQRIRRKIIVTRVSYSRRQSLFLPDCPNSTWLFWRIYFFFSNLVDWISLFRGKHIQFDYRWPVDEYNVPQNLIDKIVDQWTLILLMSRQQHCMSAFFT